MKTVKTIFAILFLSTMFIACEANTVNDEVGIEDVDTTATGDQDAGDEVAPGKE
ncbi:hypothetical protein [Aquimarina atlantica]|uniref:hypothetical protein n=1 Tax=Aquimarina atlantica TaxID=1317122 RepID=UPI000A75131B|nr:hypothetical protein [Aquimarina atlantica]